MAKRDGIHYTVHPTPKRKGETEQTYHVRRHYFTTLKSEDIVDHIRYHGSIVDLATYTLVMESLKEEIVELLQSGHDLHIEGLGRFCLQLGTRKTRGKDGRMHAKRYLNPEDITAREVVVKGISFTPDKAMLKRIRDYHAHFQHDKGGLHRRTRSRRTAQAAGCVLREERSLHAAGIPAGVRILALPCRQDSHATGLGALSQILSRGVGPFLRL